MIKYSVYVHVLYMSLQLYVLVSTRCVNFLHVSTYCMSLYPSNRLMEWERKFIYINEMFLQSESLPNMLNSTSTVVVNYFQTTDVIACDTIKSILRRTLHTGQYHMYMCISCFIYKYINVSTLFCFF